MDSDTNTSAHKGMVDKMLNRTEGNILRGIAIVGIVLHNYCHWLRPIVKENEYQFNQHNVDWFNNVMAHGFNERTFFHLLSFFGHYGVPIFLFLSAYGLVMKYEGAKKQSLPDSGSTNEPNALSFLRYHWLKLFRMMIVGFAAFVLVDAMTEGQHHYEVMDIVAQMGLFNNLLPNPDDIIWPGPYWFFGLMLQLYIVYRLFLYRKGWTWVVAFIAVCTIIELLCEPNGEPLNRWRYNFVGGMLPFGLGLLYAKYMRNVSLRIYGATFIVSLLLIRFGSSHFFTWLFVPMFVCSASVSFVKLLSYWNTHYPKYTFGIAKTFDWLGVISAALFISHPITRKIIIPISRGGDYWTGLLLYIIASVCVAWLFKEIMRRVPSPKL
ncbi:acyltransferase family protein [Prevotella intermedia]|uniref:acyltransferase family protein n=1 Tax=Prevotella intermedia TaxID=28131 RepID=UPI002006A37A|nr:acyltransferase [Prevotella intermedia]